VPSRSTIGRSKAEVLGFLAFVVGVLLVGGLLFLGASLLLGRGETQPPADLDRSPVELPDDRPVTGDDVRALQVSVAFRGYRMTEVDWLLDQFAQALDDRDRVIADLRAKLHPPAHPSPHPRHAAPGAGATEPERTSGTESPADGGDAEPPAEEPTEQDQAASGEESEEEHRA
jgi:DivIVA domain-containing protein